MPLDSIAISRLISAGESQSVEFKTSIPNVDTIANHISAFANADGGVLLMGVKEPATVVGINPSKARYAIAAALKKVSPHLKADWDIVRVNDSDLAYINVLSTKPLVASSGGFYKRIATQIRPLTADEIGESALPQSAIERSLATLSENSAKQADRIDTMTEELRKANSMPRKIAIAAVGAVLGAVAKSLVGLAH